MELLVIEPEFQSLFARLGLGSCADVLKFFAEPESPLTTTVLVKPKVLRRPDDSSLNVFYKLYEYQSPSWRFLGRASKARREYDNYGAFLQLGVPTARRVACGEQRDWLGRLCRAFVITEVIPRAWTLPQFVEEHCPDRSTPESRTLRDALSRSLAKLARRIHDAKFFHHDLVWRNVLVTWEPPAEPALWWIDCPRGQFDRWSPLQRHRLIKDLASLDKSAAKYCSLCERLDFLKHYLGKTKLDAESKALARETLEYRKRRWPDDWR